MKKTVYGVMALLLLLALAVPAVIPTPILAATTYYVDASVGSSGDGSSGSPWKTISEAVAAVPAGSPGDPNIISVAAGTYDNALGETFPIVFSNDDVSLVSASGAASTTIVGDAVQNSAILTILAEGITVQGFTFENCDAAIGALKGGFTVLDNVFSNVTDYNAEIGVVVDIDESTSALSTDFSFDDILIDNNTFFVDEFGVLIIIDLNYDDSTPGLSVNFGDMDFTNNTFNLADAASSDGTLGASGVDISLYVDYLRSGSITVGEIYANLNTFNSGEDGFDFEDGDFDHLANTTVTVGDIIVDNNTFTDQEDESIDIDYYDANNWSGTTTGTYGNLQITYNDVSSSVGNDGIAVNDYGDWWSFDDSASLTSGQITISHNQIDAVNEGIYLNFYEIGYSMYENSQIITGDVRIEDNDDIVAGDIGISLNYYSIGYYLYNNSSVTLGDLYIQRNTIDATGEAIYTYLYQVAYEMYNSSQCLIGDIYIRDNDNIASTGDGIYIYYYDYYVGSYMYDDSYAEIPGFVVSGNTFNVDADSIELYTYSNPDDNYGNAEAHFGGYDIDDNVINGGENGVYFYIEDFCEECYDTTVSTFGDVSITNNEFNGLSGNAIFLVYDEIPYALYSGASLTFGDTLIDGNAVDGADSGIYIYFTDIDPSSLDKLTINDNEISNFGTYGVYLYMDSGYASPSMMHSGDYAWYSHDDYGDQDTTLTGTFDLTGTTSPELTFWHWYTTESCCDGGRVEVSTDSGSTWSPIDPVGGYPGTGYWNSGDYSDSSNGWKQATFDLTAYAGTTIGLRFRYAGDSSANYVGWFIDDIEISGYPLDDCESGTGSWVASASQGSIWSRGTLSDIGLMSVAVTENTISSGGSEGVYVEGFGGADISGNTVSGCAYGLYLYESNRNTVEENTFQNNADGIYLADSHSSQITCNDILNNGISSSGIHLDNSGDTVINNNNITGNGTHGIYNENAIDTVDAEDNWWGASDGPSGQGSGTGDAVSTDVDFDPWLTEQSGCSPSAPTTGTIIINKTTTPGGGTGFGFTDNIDSPNSFTLDDGQAETFLNVPAGIYTVTEDDPAPFYALTGLAAVDPDGGSSVNLGNRTITIDLDPGETVECTFMNTEEQVVLPDVDVTKDDALNSDTDGDMNADPGDFIRYTVVITNNGTGDALDVFFNDTPDANTTLHSGPGYLTTSQGTFVTGEAPGDTSVSVNIGTIPSGGSVTIVFDVMVNWAFPAGGGVVCNQGIVSGSNFSSVDTDDLDTLEIADDPTCMPVPPQPGTITIIKATSPSGGTDFGFTDDIDSPNSFTLDDGQSQTFQDVLPGNYTVTEILPEHWYLTDCNCTGGDYTLVTDGVNIQLDLGENITCTFTNTQQLPFLEADLSVAKSDAIDPVTEGDDVTYTVTVTNNGPDTATNVVLTDNLPAGVIYVSATPDQGSCSQACGIVTCNLGDIASGVSVNVVIDITTTTSSGMITNHASVTSDTPDPDTGNNSVSEDTTVDMDVCPDKDRDGICDEDDNCINTPNRDQLNSDNDKYGDACDNCPYTTNPGQQDTDGDGIGDACESDPPVPEVATIVLLGIGLAALGGFVCLRRRRAATTT